jgi:hypothetical protein
LSNEGPISTNLGYFRPAKVKWLINYKFKQVKREVHFKKMDSLVSFRLLGLQDRSLDLCTSPGGNLRRVHNMILTFTKLWRLKIHFKKLCFFSLFPTAWLTWPEPWPSHKSGRRATFYNSIFKNIIFLNLMIKSLIVNSLNSSK